MSLVFIQLDKLPLSDIKQDSPHSNTRTHRKMVQTSKDVIETITWSHVERIYHRILRLKGFASASTGGALWKTASREVTFPPTAQFMNKSLKFSDKGVDQRYDMLKGNLNYAPAYETLKMSNSLDEICSRDHLLPAFWPAWLCITTISLKAVVLDHRLLCGTSCGNLWFILWKGVFSVTRDITGFRLNSSCFMTCD